jgi:hypothetical protein
MEIAISASEKKRTSKYFFTSSLLKTVCPLQLLLQMQRLKTYAICKKQQRKSFVKPKQIINTAHIEY